MNFLAHLLLAGDQDESIIGNFIADHVKGNAIELFPEGIRKGILMHRSVDHFTDHHPVVKKSILRLRPVYRKYSGVIVDMFYDHYLAKEWKQYSGISLQEFSQSRYSVLRRHQALLPPRSQRVLHYMAEYDWLVSYAGLDGLSTAFQGMSKRTTFNSRMENAVNDMMKCYECYEEEFRIFFPELQAYVAGNAGDFFMNR